MLGTEKKRQDEGYKNKNKSLITSHSHRFHSENVFDSLSITIRVLSVKYWSTWPSTFTKCNIFWTPFLKSSIFSALDGSSYESLKVRNDIVDPNLGAVNGLLTGTLNVGTFRVGILNFGFFNFGKPSFGMKALGGAMAIGAWVSLYPSWSMSALSTTTNLPSLTASGITLWMRLQKESTSNFPFLSDAFVFRIDPRMDES